MSVQFTWLGHSCFSMEIDGHSVLFDPFLTGNPLAAADPDTLNPEILFLSHAHGDHTADAAGIAARTGCTVVSNFEVAEWMKKHGARGEVHGQNHGGTGDYGFLTAKLTVAFHSSSFPDGTYGGEPNGFLITTTASQQRLYFAGDTALFSDMQLIADQGQIDVAFLPIGDYYTMGVTDSVRAIRYLRPRFVVPMHYNTFPGIVQNVITWASQVTRETNAQPIVLDPGGSFHLPD